jgi:hypothetical protein
MLASAESRLDEHEAGLHEEDETDPEDDEEEVQSRLGGAGISRNLGKREGIELVRVERGAGR